MNSFFENMQLWKLHTLSDYINLVLFLLFFISATIFITNQYKKRRNDKVAADKVCKKLRRIGSSKTIVLPHVKLKIGTQLLDLDGLLISANAVYIIKCYGWGTMIKGSSKGHEWLFTHGEQFRKLPNPLPELRRQASVISNYLLNNNCKIKVAPLIVFADNFSRPIYDLDSAAKPYATNYQSLKKWARQNSISNHIRGSAEKIADTIKTAAV